MAQGYLMVPIRPRGAVEHRILAQEAADAHAPQAELAPQPAPELQDCFSVVVQTQKGQKREVNVSSDALVETLMKSVSEATRVPVPCMRLTFQGEELKAGRCISDYGIYAECVLDIGVGVAGGA